MLTLQFCNTIFQLLLLGVKIQFIMLFLSASSDFDSFTGMVKRNIDRMDMAWLSISTLLTNTVILHYQDKIHQALC